ncbi:MAG: sialidase family protein, partial [Nanoarchaeota archaeon]
MPDIKKFKKEKSKLVKQINKLASQRKNTIKRIKKLNNSFKNNRLSSIDYTSSLKRLLHNHSFNYWINLNSKSINVLQDKLYIIDAKLKGSDKIYVQKNLFLLLSLILFSLTFFYLDPSITGLSVLDSQITITTNTSINLDKNLSSLALSGTIDGEGTARIYLNNLLVLDSTQLSLSQDKLTSQNQENNSNVTSDLFSIQPITQSSLVEFNNICIETCNNLSLDNPVLNIELTKVSITITNFNYTIKQEVIENNTPLDQIPNQENSTQISENLTIINPPITENLTLSQENLSLNTSIIELNLTQNISFQEELIQVKAEINNPVEWKLITKNKTIELPLEAVNIEVNKIDEKEERIKAKLKDQFSSSQVFPEAFSQKGSKKIEVDEPNETKIEVTYTTKAPYLLEEPFYAKASPKIFIKNITIKSYSEVHYNNVLSYTTLNPEIQSKEQLKLYHYIYNNLTNTTEKQDITSSQLYNLSYEDTNNNSLIDKLYWYTPELSEQNFSVEISLTILTLQSYPVVNGNWTILFNTTGQADLTIKAVNGTTWSEPSVPTPPDTDLIFLELKCGSLIQTYQWLNNSVFIPSYQCNETSQEISKVLTTGVHTIEFTFENITKYAYNLANVLNITLLSPINRTVTSNLSVTLNVSQEGNITNLIIYGGNSTDLDYNNVLYRNVSITGVQSNNITYNFSSLPIKPQGDGSDGLVLLYHFDNITNFEDNTKIFDFSTNRKNASTYSSITTLGSTWNSSGKLGGAITYDGINDYISIPFAYNITNITVSFWFNPSFSFDDSTKSLNRLFVMDSAGSTNTTILASYDHLYDRFTLSVVNDTTWTNTGDLASATDVHSLLQASDGTLYASTIPNGDVFKSADNGTTWTNTGALASATDVYSLLQSSDGTLYAGTRPNGDVFKSADNGTTWTNTGDLASATDVYSLLQSSDGTLYAGTSPNGDVFKINNTFLKTSVQLFSSGNWQHITFMLNSTGKKIYINGIESVSDNVPFFGLSLSRILIAGDFYSQEGDGGYKSKTKEYDGSYTKNTRNFYFNGTIDEVAIWNKSLSDTEIANLYNLSYGKYYWKANATDSAGNVNNTAIQQFTIGTTPV